jgi:uncharacterized protein YceK
MKCLIAYITSILLSQGYLQRIRDWNYAARWNLAQQLFRKTAGFVLLLFVCAFACGCSSVVNVTKIRQEYIYTHPEISNRVKEAITEGGVYTGMSIEEIKASRPEYASCLNYPDSSSVTTFGSYTTYNCHRSVYFNFRNDKLESVNQFDY